MIGRPFCSVKINRTAPIERDSFSDRKKVFPIYKKDVPYRGTSLTARFSSYGPQYMLLLLS